MASDADRLRAIADKRVADSPNEDFVQDQRVQHYADALADVILGEQ